MTSTVLKHGNDRSIKQSMPGVLSSDKDTVLSYLKDLAYANTGKQHQYISVFHEHACNMYVYSLSGYHVKNC